LRANRLDRNFSTVATTLASTCAVYLLPPISSQLPDQRLEYCVTNPDQPSTSSLCEVSAPLFAFSRSNMGKTPERWPPPCSHTGSTKRFDLARSFPWLSAFARSTRQA
jgi:hypothetical protein